MGTECVSGGPALSIKCYNCLIFTSDFIMSSHRAITQLGMVEIQNSVKFYFYHYLYYDYDSNFYKKSRVINSNQIKSSTSTVAGVSFIVLSDFTSIRRHTWPGVTTSPPTRPSFLLDQ